MNKLFGETKLTWKKLLIFSIVAGIYTGIVAMLSITKDTSFRDISISFEVWILFGIFIIMNSKSAKDSALKCFIFFLVSQPLVYLTQDLINNSRLFMTYYKNWIVWTLTCYPMGYIGYYIKKDKWWGLLILTPILLFLGVHYIAFLSETISFFPNHLLSTLFCIVTILMYPLVMFKNKKIKYIELIISILIIVISTTIVLYNGKVTYNTTIMASNGSEKITFDDSYKVYLKNKKYGKVYIVYEQNIEDYIVNAEFTKTGKTEFVIESPAGKKTVYDINIKRDTYNIVRKQ